MSGEEEEDFELAETEELVSWSYFDSCIEKPHKSIFNGSHGLSTKVEGMNIKINGLENQMKVMQQSEANDKKNQPL